MKRIVLLTIALLASSAAFAQSRDCRSSDPDKAIEGCSADIAEPASTGMLIIYYNLRASAYEKKEMLDEAKADLDKAVSLAPGFVIYFNRAAFCNDHGMVSCALADFQEAIVAYQKWPGKSLEDSFAQANFRLAEIFSVNGRTAEAMPKYDKAVAMRPDNLEFRFNRALARSRLGRDDAVISDLTQVIDASPRRGPFYVSGLNNRGLAYMRKGNFPRAIADLDRALDADSGSPGTLVRRGIIFEKAGQRDKAIADYRAALAVYAKLDEALEGLQRLGVAP